MMLVSAVARIAYGANLPEGRTAVLQESIDDAFFVSAVARIASETRSAGDKAHSAETSESA